MQQYDYQRVQQDPLFKQLVQSRARWAWGLSACILLVYFTFIMLIAFQPQWLAQPLSADSLITSGILLGVLIIVGAFLLTGVYVYQANTRFDALTQQIAKNAHD